jgi:Tfp pilus assembly protein PilV
MASTISAGTTSGTAIAIAGDTSGSLALQTNNGTTAVTVTTAQNVGIGTDSPEGKLHVLSGSAGTVTAPSNFPLVLEGTTIAGISVLTSNTGEGRIWFGDPDDNDVGRIEYAHSTNAMTFRTNATDRMVINSSGYFKQTSTGTYAFSGTSTNEFNGNANTSALIVTNQLASGTIGGISAIYSAQAPNNTSSYFLECGDTTNTKLIVYSTGTVSNRTGTYNTISDAKLKENITDASSKLDKLMDVKVRNYNLIGDELKQIGFVAQELETVFPSLIDDVPDLDENKEPTGEVTKGVKLTVMIPILVKALQELNSKVDEQATTITDLTTRLAELERAK